MIKPLKIAVVFDQVIEDGGGYQQSLNAALLIKKISDSIVDPVFITTRDANVEILRGYGIEAVYLSFSAFQIAFNKMKRIFIGQLWVLRLLHRLSGHNQLERQFADYGIDLVYFLSPSLLAINLECLNYMTTVWDLSHLEDPEFPEIRERYEFENREYFYKNVLPKASGIIVDSIDGKNNVCRFYGISDDRVTVIPFSPALGTVISDDEYRKGFIDIKEKYQLKMPYVFYPAQLWAHKNHIYILEGLKILKEKYGYTVGVIFAGGNKGNFEYLCQQVNSYDIVDRVRFAGFVPNEEMPYLYKQSLALVMPTYFGPTNLPPLEAMRLGVPVLYSNKNGLKNQTDGAALLLDLQDPESMALHIVNLLEDSQLSLSLKELGFAKINEFSEIACVQSMEKIFTKFQRKRICWE